jgi:hypothetical protein
MVNVDMIGRPLIDQPALAPLKWAAAIDGARSVGLLGARARPALRALVDRSCAGAGVAAVAPEDLPEPVDREVSRQSEGRGDSVSFEAAGVPALFFGSGESSDYHRSTDTVDRVRPDIMERRARALAEVVVALSRAPPETFRGDMAATPSGPRHAWKLPIGVAVGRSIHPNAPDGTYLGFEASVVGFETRSLAWLGGYLDVTRDFASGRTRASVGPELGLGPFGVDGGYLVELSGSQRRQGFAVRPMLSLAYLSLTGRLGYLFGAQTAAFGEVGALVKIPLFGRW